MAISSGKDPYWTAKRGTVQNGLIFHANFSVTQSYPGTGNILYDLSGNGSSGTMINGANYLSSNGGIINFDGVDDYITGTFRSSLTSFPFTLSVWSKFQYRGMGGSPSLQFDLCVGVSNVQFFGIGSVQYSNTSGPTLVARNTSFYALEYNPGLSPIYSEKWNNVVGVFVSDTQKDLYINGNYFATLATSIPFAAPSIFVLGAGPAPSFFSRSLSNDFIVYNRALTASEIQQNFNATRKRFGV